MQLAFDTETTGFDFKHGCRPFFVSICDEDENQMCWEWDVDYKTRQIIPQTDRYVLKNDLVKIRDILWSAERITGQNIKFDVHGMVSLDPMFLDWPWKKTDDTLNAAHVLGSNELKNLTVLCLQFLDFDISKYEADLRKAVDAARRLCMSKSFKAEYGEWRIGKDEDPMLPSGGGIGSDYALPKTLYDTFDWVRKEHPDWKTVLNIYGNVDTSVLLPLRTMMWAELERRKDMCFYESRMEILPVLFQMEEDGVTVHKNKIDQLTKDYSKVQQDRAKVCTDIAKSLGHELVLPKGASPNDNIREFVFDVMKLPPLYAKKGKSPNPTLNKEAIAIYLETLPEESHGHRFFKALLAKRKVDTALSYMDSYRRFWQPTAYSNVTRLFPSVNPVGTTVTRRSSSNPNEQNISKKKDDDDISLRNGFGPEPGREQWSMDYENIELRIPAYEIKEEDLMALFENPDEPPFFGSEHLLNFSVVYPEIWEKELPFQMNDKEHIKNKYKSTYYQWCKNGDFAIGYQAGDKTADAAFHREGSRQRLIKRFSKKDGLNTYWVQFANENGFIRTMPDKTVDPERGYPVCVSRQERGGVRPTEPLSYHVQGTAGWCMGKALIRCGAQIEAWNKEAGRRAYKLIMEVHDELVFDFPAGGKKNLPLVRKLKYLMEKSGDDIGVPLKVSVSYHPRNWGEEVPCE